MPETASYNIDGLHLVDGCLIVTVDREPDDALLRHLRGRILAKMETVPVRGVVMDVSRVRVLDSVLFLILAETARMVELMGKRSVFVGFQSGIASALVDLDVDLDGIETARNMEDGLEIMRPAPEPEDEAPLEEEQPPAEEEADPDVEEK